MAGGVQSCWMCWFWHPLLLKHRGWHDRTSALVTIIRFLYTNSPANIFVRENWLTTCVCGHIFSFTSVVVVNLTQLPREKQTILMNVWKLNTLNSLHWVLRPKQSNEADLSNGLGRAQDRITSGDPVRSLLNLPCTHTDTHFLFRQSTLYLSSLSKWRACIKDGIKIWGLRDRAGALLTLATSCVKIHLDMTKTIKHNEIICNS